MKLSRFDTGRNPARKPDFRPEVLLRNIEWFLFLFFCSYSCLPHCLSVGLLARLPVRPCIRPFVGLSVCLSVCTSVCRAPRICTNTSPAGSWGSIFLAFLDPWTPARLVVVYIVGSRMSVSQFICLCVRLLMCDFFVRCWFCSLWIGRQCSLRPDRFS